VRVGRSAKLKKTIIDENIAISEGMEIGFDHEKDRLRGRIVTGSGIVMVTK
jgi:glucose-1-phosphate adenylyltransferase